jgi:Ca2+-dependent lipid-binding protein
MLQVQIYQAKELPAADAQGASDPFAVVRCGRNQARTQVCKATTSPAWFREIFLEAGGINDNKSTRSTLNILILLRASA